MKNFFKLFGITALVAVIGFSMVGCDLENNDYDLFNGDWENVGQYVVTFNDGKGVFKELNGGIWLSAKNGGQIKIGDQCYRNFTKSDDRKWTGEIRIYNNSSPHQTLRWENCTITLSANGQTLQVSTDGTGTFSLTKK